jgi:GYF domain 2
MANYIIIGGDQKEYGPITADDVRQWIGEGRLGKQSLMKAESDAEFRPLEKFPEFASAFGAKAPLPGMPPPLGSTGIGDRETALRRIQAPAVALMVVSILNIVLALWSLLQLIFTNPNLQQLNSELAQLNNPQIEQFTQKLFHLMYGPLGIVNVIVELAISVLILVGAKKMMALQSYEFALAAATLSMVPCLTPCCGYLLGVAFGIWALVVLRKPEVKSHFS